MPKPPRLDRPRRRASGLLIGWPHARARAGGFGGGGKRWLLEIRRPKTGSFSSKNREAIGKRWRIAMKD